MGKRDHKKALARRANRIKAKNAVLQPESPTQEQKEVVFNEYSEDSGFSVMPSMVEALGFQDIASDEKFAVARDKTTEWLVDGVKSVIAQAKALDYLPNMAITFVLPLGFHLPLPEYYVSGAISGLKNATEANCVTVFSKILPVGNAGIKTSYMLISMCDNEVVRLARTKKVSSYQVLFNKAVALANNVIAGLQSVHNIHNHNMHNLTPLSVNAIIQWYFTDRSTRGCSEIQKATDEERLFTDILTSQPIVGDALEHYKINHSWAYFTGDKVFALISLFNSAVNSRCFGRDDQAILSADTFVEYALGYIYCEIKAVMGDELVDAVKNFNQMTKSGIGAVWGEYVKMLDYEDSKEGIEALKNDVGFGKYDVHCRDKRNDLHHHFMANNYNETDSLLAVYYSGEMIRKLCELVLKKYSQKNSLLPAKLELLRNSTLFFKGMTEHLSEVNRDERGKKVINLD